MEKRRFFTGMMASAFMLVIILDGQTALNGARSGIELCLMNVIPSLFPFFVLSRVLISVLSGADLVIFTPLARLCSIPPEGVSILLCGLIGGYPVGARSLSQAYREGRLDRKTAERMLAFSNNAGPSFIFGMAGCMFPDPKAAWLLWLIHIASAILCATLLPGGNTHSASQPVSFTPLSLPHILKDAVQTMGTVCGWVVLFRVIIAFVQRWFLWLLPQELQVICAGFLELSNGCCSLSGVADLSIRFMICSAILAFGGLCVCMQTISVIDTLSYFPYIRGKLLQVILSVSLCIGFLYRSWFPFLLIYILLRILIKKGVAIRSQMLYNGPTNLRRHHYAVSKEN